MTDPFICDEVSHLFHRRECIGDRDRQATRAQERDVILRITNPYDALGCEVQSL